MNFKEEIGQLHFPKDSFMVVGSGILNALHIRTSNDIDMIISKELFHLLKNRSWKLAERADGTIKITYKQFECMTDWYGKTLEVMLKDAIYIDGVPYMSLDDVYEWKQHLGRPKDITDLQLIKNYRLQA
jgi:hypothetical protein